MDGWNTILSFWGPAYFQGQKVSFREGRISGNASFCPGSTGASLGVIEGAVLFFVEFWWILVWRKYFAERYSCVIEPKPENGFLIRM